MDSNNLYQLLHQQFGGLKQHGLWPISRENPETFFAHGNGLIALGLSLSGYLSEARQLMSDLTKSTLTSEHALLHYSIQGSGGVLTRQHSCTGGIIACALTVVGESNSADLMLADLRASALWNPKKKLYSRAMWQTGELADERLITHSNLWIVLAYILRGCLNEALELLRAVEREFGQDQSGLLFGTSCEHDSSHFYPDDNALYAICLELLGRHSLAAGLLFRLKSSPLYVVKQQAFGYEKTGLAVGEKHISSYKNNFCQAAYRLVGVDIAPYDQEKELIYSDSLGLGLMAEGVEGLRNFGMKSGGLSHEKLV